MMAFAIPAALLVVLPTPATSASLPLAERIFQAAIAAPAQTGEGRLYSYRIWTPSTKKKIGPLTYDGFLSCAIVVSAILKEAGHDIGKQYSVDGIAPEYSVIVTEVSADAAGPTTTISVDAVASTAEDQIQLRLIERSPVVVSRLP